MNDLFGDEVKKPRKKVNGGLLRRLPTDPPPTGFDLTYLSFGAGTQSTALLICSALGLHGVPRADVAIFADTMNEPAHVYQAVERMKAWAAPYIPVVVVSAGDLLGHAKERLAGTRSRFASIPLFTTGKDGRAAPGRRQCTSEYKIDPIEKHVRQMLGYKPRQVIRKKVLNLVGISLEEASWRVKPSRTRWITRSHPLVDALLDRDACIKLVMDHGLPMPRKSACVFCPYTDNARWREMRAEDPESFERACAADEALRDQSRSGMQHMSYVHRSRKALRTIDFDRLIDDGEPLLDAGGFNNECEGMCGV